MVLSLLSGAGDDYVLPEFKKTTKMPVRAVDRPLTLTKNTFGLFFDLGYSALAPEVPVLSLAVGTGFGITDDLEVTLTVLPVTFSKEPTSGLGLPAARLSYRF